MSYEGKKEILSLEKEVYRLWKEGLRDKDISVKLNNDLTYLQIKDLRCRRGWCRRQNNASKLGPKATANNYEDDKLLIISPKETMENWIKEIHKKYKSSIPIDQFRKSLKTLEGQKFLMKVAQAR